MKLSAASSYAVRALAHLARRPPGASERTHDIARAAGLADAQLAKILGRLVRAGLLSAVKGPGGGYVLARPARQITLLAIIEATDGRVGGAAIAGADGATPLDRRLQAACDDAAESLRQRLARVTLAELARAR
jgi:Rrf2 family iron-sulfur cluster assembly transcriptional regulator